MKQILQNLKNGVTEVADVPVPTAARGALLIRTSHSLVSAGTERMLVDFGRGNLLQKARVPLVTLLIFHHVLAEQFRGSRRSRIQFTIKTFDLPHVRLLAIPLFFPYPGNDAAQYGELLDNLRKIEA